MTTRPSGGAICSSRHLPASRQTSNCPGLRLWAAQSCVYNRNAGSYSRQWLGSDRPLILASPYSIPWRRSNGMSDMTADVADHVDECEVAVGEVPLAVDTLKAVW